MITRGCNPRVFARTWCHAEQNKNYYCLKCIIVCQKISLELMISDKLSKINLLIRKKIVEKLSSRIRENREKLGSRVINSKPFINLSSTWHLPQMDYFYIAGHLCDIRLKPINDYAKNGIQNKFYLLISVTVEEKR